MSINIITILGIFLEILTEHKLKLVTLRSLVDVVDKDLADSRRSIPV